MAKIRPFHPLDHGDNILGNATLIIWKSKICGVNAVCVLLKIQEIIKREA
jgi:hypothetical protein